MAVQIIFETHSVSTDNEAGVATGWLPGRSPHGAGSWPGRSGSVALRPSPP